MAGKGYAVASGLVGFRSTSLRVIVTRRSGAYVWVVTADLLDAGTPLVLSPNQVVMEADQAGYSAPWRHRDGLVTFGS